MIKVFNEYSPVNPPELGGSSETEYFAVDDSAPGVSVLWIDDDGVSNIITGSGFVISEEEPTDTTALWINPADITTGNIAVYDTDNDEWTTGTQVSGTKFVISERNPATNALWIDNSEDNNLVINYTLPARRTIRINGLWNGSEYTTQEVYWIPGTQVQLPTPQTIMEGMGEDDRCLMTPQNTDIMLNDSSYVRLKGFASKQAVAEYLESTFLDNGELSEYYDLVSNTWDDSDLYQNFMNGDGEFEFSEQKYLSGAFPYELLFEGECDITMNGEGTLIFQANADLSTPQDLFAIYERDDITYTFYKPDNTVYATKSVTYGESPTDPSVGTGAPALPSDVTTRYALTSSNVDGNIVWTATEDSQAQSNYVESFYRVADLSQRWCEAGDSDETAVQLRNYTAGTSGQTTSFKMRLYTQIPLVYVVDGVIEGFAGSYNANNGVHPVRGDVLKNYSNYAISRMQRWTTRPLQAPQVYTDSTYAIRAMDGSICWFVDAACQQTRLTSITMHGTMEPMIVYAKLRNVYCLSFDGLSGGALTIANNVGTAPSYSYNGESLSLLAPQIISNSVYATTGTTISLSGLDFRKSTDTTFDVVSGWKYTSDDSAVSSTFSLTANTEVAPVTTTHDKPKLKIKLDFTHDFWDSDSDGIMHDDGKQVELDENNINSQLYVYSYYTDDGDDYVEITAKAATADNLTTNWVFDMSDIPLHVLGCDNEYILLECTNNSPSCLADNYTTTSPIIIYLVDIYKNGHLIFQDSSVWVGARIGFDEPNAIYERDDGKRLTTIYSSDINNINVVPNGYNTTPIEPMPARDVTYTFISYIT